MINSNEAYERSIQSQTSMVNNLITKVEKAIDNATENGRFEVTIDINGFTDEAVDYVIKLLKRKKYRISYAMISGGTVYEQWIEINWAPSRYARFVKWLDSLNEKIFEKVGVILNTHG